MSKIVGAHIPAEEKNGIINGNFDFFQAQNTVNPIITSTSTQGYVADMWKYFAISTGTTLNFSVQYTSSNPSPTLSGFGSSTGYTAQAGAAIASFSAGEYIDGLCHVMEGFNFQTYVKQTVTFGFWVQAQVAGTYSFAIRNGTTNRSYVTTFTVNASGVWQYISITVQMDQAGTWALDNSLAMYMSIGAVAGSTYSTSTLNTWQSGNFIAATGATNWYASTNYLTISQVSMVKGTYGLGSKGFIRNGKTIEQELASCQRYYEKSYELGTAPASATTTGICAMVSTVINSSSPLGANSIFYSVEKRAVPAISYWDGAGNANKSSSYYGSWTNNISGVTVQANGTKNFLIDQSAINLSGSGNISTAIHYVADARL